ncbi:MAG: hypothetical protein LHV69_06250 [Elusimicrobia bacterium]|nr:hypothetical protein [Candidatus Obscuribacterium magneticum]
MKKRNLSKSLLKRSLPPAGSFIFASFFLILWNPFLYGGGLLTLDSSALSLGTREDVDVEDGQLSLTGRWDYSSSPLSTRYHMGFAYDSNRHQSLVFGGRNHLGSVFGDTWLWDPSLGWTQESPPDPPSTRYGHNLVWTGDKYLLFGGRDASDQYLNDTWIYDPALNSWTYVVTSSTPEARAFFAMAYSPDQNKVVVVGGEGAGGFAVPGFTWVYDVAASSWSKLNLDPAPSIRIGCSMAYDQASHRMILFGGRGDGWNSSDLLDDTWSFDVANAVWEEKIPLSKPAARADAALTYDLRHSQIVLYGGRNTPTGYMGDTYFYHFGKNRWQSFLVDSSPAGRYGHQIVFSTASTTGIVFGGCRDVATNALWSYTLTSTGTWASLSTQGSGSTLLTWGNLSVEFVDPSIDPPPAPDTSVRVRMASSVDGVNYDSFRGPDGSTDTYYVFTSLDPQAIWAGHENKRFFKLTALFVSDDIPSRPHVSAFRLTYNQAPTAGVLKSPPDGSRTNQSKPLYKWELSADNDGLGDFPLLYQLQVDDTTNFTDPVISIEGIPKDVSDVSTAPQTALSEGLWVWRARAKDNAGLYGDWSTSFSLLVDTTTPPGPVTQMAASMGPGNGEITLTWIFPGDDDGRLDNGETIVRFSTQGPILTEEAWDAAGGEQTAALNANPAETVLSIVTDLADATSYYFAVKTEDELGNRSNLSTVSPSAVTNGPPKPVTQMTAAKGPANAQISLTWIFPGDDVGRVDNGNVYIHFSTQGSILTEEAWNAAAAGEQTAALNANPGEAVVSVVSDLAEATTYYFAIKTEDGLGNRSNLSTISPFALTNGPPKPVTQITAARGPGNGQVTLTWIFPGDDVGRLDNGSVRIRYASQGPILTEGAWSAAAGEQIAALSADPDETITSTVMGLANATTYYFAIKTEDDVESMSPLSTVSPYAMTNASPTVTLLSPNGGESVQQYALISWVASDPNPEDSLTTTLRLSLNGGVSYPIEISGGIPAGTTAYLWGSGGLPNGSSFRVQVVVTDPMGLSASDGSDGNFHKDGFDQPPGVAFTASPTKGQKISGDFAIQWTVSNPSPYITYSFTLSLSPNAGQSYVFLTSGTPTSYTLDTKAWPNLSSYQLELVAADSGDPPLNATVHTDIFEIYNPVPPQAFRLLKPLEGDFPTVFDLSFSWEIAVGAGGENIVYSLHYSTDSALTGGVVVPDLAQTSYSPLRGSLLMDTNYYWQVTARTPSSLETKSSTGQFSISTCKAKSSDGLLTVEILSGGQSQGFLSIQDARSTHKEFIDQGDLDSRGDALIQVLDYPAWNIQIKDINENTLSVDTVVARLTCLIGDEEAPQSLDPTPFDVHLFKIANLNQSRERWEIVPTQDVLSSGSKQITAMVNHLSVYSVVGSPTPSENLSGITNFPNPFAAGKESTHIRYILTQDSHVTIRIYTFLGDLVYVADFPPGSTGGMGSSLGFTNEIMWDGKNGNKTTVANGVYLMEIRAEGEGGLNKAIRRIGVLK